MNRTDTKFLMPASKLSDLLGLLPSYYYCLEVNGHRLSDYKTLYFDTPALKFYHDHQSGRLKRYKVRRRNYVQTGQSFLEVKCKNNKGRTIKNRINQPFLPFISGYEEERDFLAHQIPVATESLRPVLWVEYTRITLVNRYASERLTLDLNLKFRNDRAEKGYEAIVIAEVK